MKKITRPLIIFNISIYLHIACTFSNSDHRENVYSDYDVSLVPYKLYEPDSIIRLHSDLEEISGLSYYKDNMLTAVEDERGRLYFIDKNTGKVIRKQKFAKSGDYESLELIDSNVFIMQSDGDLYTFDLGRGVEAKKRDTKLSIKNDVEGMSRLGDELIVVTKATGDIKGNKVKGKGVYRVDPTTGDILGKALIEIALNDLNKFVKDRIFFNSLKDFDPSGIAVHPITHDIYIISADKILGVYSDKYILKEVVKLNPKLMRQPEGICFSPDGTLYIASEGDGARGKLLRYSVFSSY